MRITKITVTPPLVSQISNKIPPDIQNKLILEIPQTPQTQQSDTFKGKNDIFIPNTKEQPKCLYNKVSDIMNECKIGGVIINEGIKISTVTQKVIDKLTEFGIKFVSTVDK